VSKASFQPALLHPRHWPVWLIVGLLRLLLLLPFRVQLALGRGIGRLFLLLGKRRARIARINLELCFPELSAEEREHVLRRHFESVGIGVFELGMAWWASDRRMKRLVHIEGLEHLREAFAQGKGVILLSAHFTTLEMGGRFLALQAPDLPMAALYRQNENPVLEHLIITKRTQLWGRPIRREDVRTMLRTLRDGKIVWYASDQNFGHKGSVFADFFGVPAATNTATTRLSGMTGAPVVPFFTRRLDDGSYVQTISPPLEDFPGENPEADATRINLIIEDWVRQAPEQYFWLHRRFKDRPGDEPRFY
jgi:Kdo2-lipid IVA lauroyltransferase/acyltransferase